MDDRLSERWAWLQYAQAVLWSFFGIRRGNRARQDATQLRPVPLIVMALCLAAAFVALLLFVASVAAKGGST
ncbi:MAG TPA: DUF2970 domain-containing protein [Piscinibacter sp.]|jgi:hypothetical protein|nr:DUF2970 domain-containing protein [Piscinibacter sp.]HOY35925.1 DUF2970 domain-containing protein [Piscinibacter sp.]